MLDCFPEIKEALDNKIKPVFNLKSLAILKFSEILNFFCIDLSILPKLPNKKLAEKVKEKEIFEKLEKSYTA